MITKLLLHFQTLHLHSRQEEDETVEPITFVPYIRKAYFLRITPSSGDFHLFFSQNGITDISSSKESSEFMYLASMEVSDQEERRLKQMLSYQVNRVCQKRENLRARWLISKPSECRLLLHFNKLFQYFSFLAHI